MSSLRHTVLNQIAEIWNVKGDEVDLSEDGFDWLPGSHSVYLRIFQDERGLVEEERLCVMVGTRYRRSALVHDPQFVERVGLMSTTLCPSYSLVYPPSDVAKSELVGITPAISLFASIYVDAELARWLPRLLAEMSMLQPINAEVQCSISTEMFCGATPDFADGTKKTSTNEILAFADVIIRPEGRKPSRWVNSDEFQEFLERAGRNDDYLGAPYQAGIDGEGLLIGTPFGSVPAYITLRPDQQHPVLGNGLLVTTEIRKMHSFGDICRQAALLNYLEFKDWTDFPQLGCWGPRSADMKEAILIHACFIPNAFFTPGLVGYFAFWALQRVRWARHRLLPGVPDGLIDVVYGSN